MIIAIDPGSSVSSWVVWDPDAARVVLTDDEPNDELVDRLAEDGRRPIIESVGLLLIEHIESYGMTVGAEIFDTVFWSGRFVQAWKGEWRKVGRRDVKLVLCGSSRAKDPNVKQALVDRFGGSMIAAKGTRAMPGPLWGIKNHRWSALALAVAYVDMEKEKDRALR